MSRSEAEDYGLIRADSRAAMGQPFPTDRALQYSYSNVRFQGRCA